MAPIDLFVWPTPNGYKISIMLEEIGLPYEVHPIDITAGDQFKPEFLKISPNNKMPAIVDPDGPDGQPISIFESGAILMYLAEKTGQFWPADMRRRYKVIEWLMFQMGGFGPLLGQAHHFRVYAPETIQYAVDRYTNEAGRLYRVLDTRLGEAEYLAGEEYSIADIACFPWSRSIERQGHKLGAAQGQAPGRPDQPASARDDVRQLPVPGAVAPASRSDTRATAGELPPC